MLLAFLVITFAAAAIGGALTSTSLDSWYLTLNKPSINPPNWIFGPVWTTLYAMMGIAAWLVWRRGSWLQTRAALGLFFVQLALNVAWSGLFFGLRRPDIAFWEILLLWSAIAITAAAFWRHSTVASLLLLPYLVWVSFASLLNFWLWRLNI